MPEAAIDHDHRVEFSKYQIGSAREGPVMQSEPVTLAMKCLSNQNFRFGILCRNGSHHLTSLCLVKHVSHNRHRSDNY